MASGRAPGGVGALVAACVLAACFGGHAALARAEAPVERAESEKSSQPARQAEAPKAEQAPSLYDRLGRVYGIAAVVDDLVDRLLSDPVIQSNPRNEVRRERIPGLKYQITAMLCEITGGPEEYTGRNMAEAHEKLGITEKEWGAMIGDFRGSLERFKVPKPEQEELLTLVAGTKEDILQGSHSR